MGRLQRQRRARRAALGVIVGAKLPAHLTLGFGGLHRVSVVKARTPGTWLWFDPLRQPYARPVEIDLLPDITSDEGVDAFDDSHYLEQVPPHH